MVSENNNECRLEVPILVPILRFVCCKYRLELEFMVIGYWRTKNKTVGVGDFVKFTLMTLLSILRLSETTAPESVSSK